MVDKRIEKLKARYKQRAEKEKAKEKRFEDLEKRVKALEDKSG